MRKKKRIKERVLTVGVNTGMPRERFLYSMEELESLVRVAGGEVVGRFTQNRLTPDPAYYVGRGKIGEIAAGVRANRADTVVFNSELSPAQVKNLEEALECKVIDRSELILDIFALRARTKQARLSVELAQLEYQLPRLKRMWTHLSRMEGGIGTRGPGEKQLETDRRLARRQIQRYRRWLRKIEGRIERWVESRAGEYNVALVGYTNSGKSTLMRWFSDKNVPVKDELFATIDTRTARVDLGEGYTILLSDTVGFIEFIPHDLIESFKATLMHARSADLLLHVIDSSAPDIEHRIEVVKGILEEIGCGGIETVHVFNKIDLAADTVYLRAVAERNGRAVLVSAKTGENMESLAEAVRGVFRTRRKIFSFRVDLGEGKLLAYIRRSAEIVATRYNRNAVEMKVYGTERLKGWLERHGIEVEETDGMDPGGLCMQGGKHDTVDDDSLGTERR